MDCLTCLNAHLKYLSCGCDFGCGFLVLGGFKPVWEVLGLFLLFGFGLRVLRFSWYFKGLNQFLCDFGGKSGLIDNAICTRSDINGKCSSKTESCRCRLLRYVKNLGPPSVDKLEKANFDADADCVNEHSYCGVEHEHYDEDNEFDLLALRKLIKIERRRANSAYLELEKERMAAATAAEETMAMILRLQNEKSLIEMEANHNRRLAEEKQLHDQDVIQSLQWLVLEHESERTVLEEQLRLCQQKLKMQYDESEESQKVEDSNGSFKTNIRDAIDPSLFSSLDLDLSLE